ncbi:N-acetyltransferase [Desulfuribacillus alkaliarsenatis]|uniref:GNAT family N-acetyltransferase n=1 Tax=Desulfuribacillus alkaliarsenatis TaxID=766136 RepID=A0A1E5FZT2_9FIRM|nr:N-acetyltransferase [Desulfuribacillus alkaliarsenatis]OEF96086.1 GNAT family N-acetyltransferase [Desulfuribacillus alkaliarsenatis]
MEEKVIQLQINYKTLEEFEKFREYGQEELYMREELEENIVENQNNSPFYGMYIGDKLVARMSLYKIDKKYDRYFNPPQDYYELCKLEVLPDYQKKGLGKKLIRFAQSLGCPIKVNVRCGANSYFQNLGFEPAKYNPVRDRAENPYIWEP